MSAAPDRPDPKHVEYVLRLGDNALILGQRLCEWCGHSPFVEEDVAMANVALDHIGRARMLLTHAAELAGRGETEDDLAFNRVERQFKNFLLCELPVEDFAFTIVRQILLDAYHLVLFERLTSSTDETLAGIAAKAIKESAYHFRHSAEWTIRLGDGTDESQSRVQTALNEQWRFTSEIFDGDDIDRFAAEQGIGPSIENLRAAWSEKVAKVLTEAHLTQPPDMSLAASGRRGLHTEHMGYLLAEMQSVVRTYPGLNW